MSNLILDSLIVPYQGSMLPDVIYEKIDTKDSLFTLLDLEEGAVESCMEILDALKAVILDEKIILEPKDLIANLCAYLGAAMTVHTVHAAEKLEPLVVKLIKQQAQLAYQYFVQYPINDTVLCPELQEQNLSTLHQITPSDILMQTMYLSSMMGSSLSEEERTQTAHNQVEPDTLTKMVLYLSGKRCQKWREQLNGLSDNYVINQLAIQIGWIIGYFSHLYNQTLEQSRYFDYGIAAIKFYREHIYNLMKDFAEATHQQEAENKKKAEELLTEINQISTKAQSQTRPVVTDFQKQFLIAYAGIEKELINLLTQGCSIKIMLMSVFYFWFTLVEPLYKKSSQPAETADPFSHMPYIINLLKETVKSLPEPEFTAEINALNEKMQALKQYIPDPKSLDNVSQSQVTQQTAQINVAIHTATSEYLKQNIHPEAVANALFCNWLRLSVFFGISEKEWQKMDYYLTEILKAIKHYLSVITEAD